MSNKIPTEQRRKKWRDKRKAREISRSTNEAKRVNVMPVQDKAIGVESGTECCTVLIPTQCTINSVLVKVGASDQGQLRASAVLRINKSGTITEQRKPTTAPGAVNFGSLHISAKMGDMITVSVYAEKPAKFASVMMSAVLGVGNEGLHDPDNQGAE